MIETKNGKKIYSEFELGYKKAIEDVLKLERHYYKTYRSGFIEEQEAVFIGDIKQLEQRGE